MVLVKMSSKGQIVIPREIRKKLGLKPNTKVKLELFEDHAEIAALPDYASQLKGILKGKPSMTAELMKEHEKETKARE